MALVDFWRNVQGASRMAMLGTEVGASQLDSNHLAELLKSSADWLTPKSILGFQETDFAFLDDTERSTLIEAVHRFAAIARQVRSDQNASREQVISAREALIQIRAVLRPDKYEDPDALECGKKIDRCLAERWPESVAELRYSAEDDWRGNPALTILVIFKRGFGSEEVLLAEIPKIRRLLRDVVDELEIGRRQFTRFSTEEDEEQEEESVEESDSDVATP